MKNREFRELQVSSTQLAIIFLGILLIGVVIFLLGVSVGKKQARVAEKANVIAQKQPEQLKEKFSLPDIRPGQEPVKVAKKEEPAVQKEEPVVKKEETAVPRQALTDQLKPKPQAEEQKSEPARTPPTPPRKSNLYYVQVGALTEKPAALSTAERFRKLGFDVVVLDPMSTDKAAVYRVRVGGFATKEEADSAKSRLASAAGRKVDYFIVRD
jgi:cell division septation protein DedD